MRNLNHVGRLLSFCCSPPPLHVCLSGIKCTAKSLFMCFKECSFTSSRWYLITVKMGINGERAKKRNENFEVNSRREKWKGKKNIKSIRNLHLAPFSALFSHAVSLRSFFLQHCLQFFGKSAGKPTLLFNKQNVLRHFNPKGMRRRW